ncbi:hypothetical protein, partial [Aeromonas salmonicida]|uniref:hypothetical protein n=1 Tax=Aeromonas salmonicida TaxID=645 RepID=UPI0019D60F91
MGVLDHPPDSIGPDLSTPPGAAVRGQPLVEVAPARKSWGSPAPVRQELRQGGGEPCQCGFGRDSSAAGEQGGSVELMPVRPPKRDG